MKGSEKNKEKQGVIINVICARTGDSHCTMSFPATSSSQTHCGSMQPSLPHTVSAMIPGAKAPQGHASCICCLQNPPRLMLFHIF